MRAHDGVVLGRAHVTGREDRVVLAHEREHLAASRGAARRRRRSRRCPGPGMPSWAATPFSKSWRLLSVGSHTMRAPRSSATSTAAGFTPPTSRSQQMPPNTEIVVADVALHRPRERRGGEVVRLQHDRPVAGRRGFARGFERVDRSRPVRVGAEVTVQIGRSGEVDAHPASVDVGRASYDAPHPTRSSDLTPMSGLVREVGARARPGAARRAERGRAAAAQRAASSATAPRSGSATGRGRTPSTSRSRAGSRRSSSTGCRPTARATSRCCSTTRPSTCSRSAAPR